MGIKASPGTLVKCDASIKAMLIDIDSKHHETFIIEDLDEEHVLVKDTMVAELKQRLQGVGLHTHWRGPHITNAFTDDEGTAQGARELRIRIIDGMASSAVNAVTYGEPSPVYRSTDVHQYYMMHSPQDIVFICSAPSMADTHGMRPGAKSSATGFKSFNTLTSSKVPT